MKRIVTECKSVKLLLRHCTSLLNALIKIMVGEDWNIEIIKKYLVLNIEVEDLVLYISLRKIGSMK